MKFFVDECLSPRYVWALVERGYADAVHPMHIGTRGRRDDTIVARAFAEDRIVITANARDFRRLLSAMPLHPGAIIVEALEIQETRHQIAAAIAFSEVHAYPRAYMVNRVVEVSSADGVLPYLLAQDE